MRTKLLGDSGLRVSEICLGTMTFGDEAQEGWGASREQARGIFDAYVEAGGVFFDTAVNYCGGLSEQYLGELIKSDRDRYVVATKYTARTRPGDQNSGGNHRKSMLQALDTSLRRLGSEYIDLYWVHAWEFLTPVEEVLRTLDDAVRAGKVLYVGCSNTPAWVIARANAIAEARGWTPFSAIQVEYNLLERTVERELTQMAQALDLAVLAWAPLRRGVLTGKYLDGKGEGRARFSATDPHGDPAAVRVVELVTEIANELGATPGQVALAWLRGRRGVVIPIVGARTAEQLQESLGCLDLDLPPAALARLDEAARPSLGYPHEFLAGLRSRYLGTADAPQDHGRRLPHAP